MDIDLTDAVVEDLGKGLATMVKRAHGSTVVVGRDARESGPRFQAAFIKGVLSTGLNVIEVGVVRVDPPLGRGLGEELCHEIHVRLRRLSHRVGDVDGGYQSGCGHRFRRGRPLARRAAGEECE